MLIDPASWAVDVLVPEEDISRIRVGDHADILVLRSHLEKFAGTVAAVDTSRLATLPHPMLDAQAGGSIATLPGDKHIPSSALYKVRVTLNKQPTLNQMTIGHAIIHTQAKAWLPTQVDRVLAVLVRESGF